MAEFSDDAEERLSDGDVRYARRIVEGLLSREPDEFDLDPDLVISDVEADFETFSTELDVLQEFGENVPAIRLAGDELVPISIHSLLMYSGVGPPFPFRLGNGRFWREHPFGIEWLFFALLQVQRQGSERGEFEMMRREDARTTFLRRATDFLATRIAAVRGFRDRRPNDSSPAPSLLNLRQRVGGPHVATPGCLFTVTTNSTGLRVFWSGAYFISSNRFNHPTSPTSSVLQSGTYVFGVDGGAYGNKIQWDHNLVVSLPGMPYAHLNY